MDAVLYGQIIMGLVGLTTGAFIVWGLESWLHRAPAIVAPPPKPVEVKPVHAPTEVLVPDHKTIERAEANYAKIMNKAAEKFDHDLVKTSEMINEQIKRMSGDIIGTELENYRKGLDELREHTIKTMSQIETEATKEREVLKATMYSELAIEKERLQQQMDAKLSEAVTAFLLETLKHNVDLGAQSRYLMDMLDEHKADLRREVGHEI